MIFDAIATIAGLIIPPAYNFIKKKFLTGSDDPEETLNTLAVTKPEALAGYVTAQASLLDAQTKYFNRDVVGEPSRLVIDLRAAIRPCFVLISLGIRAASLYNGWEIDEGFKVLMDACISSWFGSRLT